MHIFINVSYLCSCDLNIGSIDTMYMSSFNKNSLLKCTVQHDNKYLYIKMTGLDI